MATSSLIGLACLAASIAATVFSVMRARRYAANFVVPEGEKRKVLMIPGSVAGMAVFLLIFHPTIWVGVRSGDCGYTLRVIGPIVAALHAGLAGFLMLKKYGARPPVS